MAATRTFNRDFDHMMVQITDTARSVRVLADLLTRHPEALIRGRTGPGAMSNADPIARIDADAAGSLRVRAWPRCRRPIRSLYTLAVVPGAMQAGAPRVIELRAIAVAHYLERSQIVRSSEDFRLDVIGQRLVGRAARRDAGPRAVAGADAAPARQHGVWRERRDHRQRRRDGGDQRAAAGRGCIRRGDADRAGRHHAAAATATRTVRYSVPPTAPGHARSGERDEHRRRPTCRYRRGDGGGVARRRGAAGTARLQGMRRSLQGRSARCRCGRPGPRHPDCSWCWC